MITYRTTFVVGAGASVDYGFPLGGQLTRQIANALTFNGSNSSPEKELMSTVISVLGRHRNLGFESEVLYREAAHLREGLTTASSIDAFLDSRHDNPKLELIGKMAIACCLITAEQACTSLRPRHSGEMIDLSASEKSWLACLFKSVLAPGIRKSQLERIFDNVSFVIFNYDRCVEHYFTHAIASHFSIDLPSAASLVSERLDIVHPYGSLGPLTDARDAVFFGQKYDPGTYLAADGIRAIAGRLLTFTESQKARAEEAKALIQNALRLVFLGFGFGEGTQSDRSSTDGTADRLGRRRGR